MPINFILRAYSFAFTSMSQNSYEYIYRHQLNKAYVPDHIFENIYGSERFMVTMW